MNIASITDLFLFSITTYVGCYYLALYLFRSDNKTNLYFALLCFAVALNALMTIGLYTSSSLPSGIIWQKGQFFCSAFMAIGFIYFTFSLLELKSNLLKKIFLLLLLLLIFCGTVLNQYILDVSQPMIKEVNLLNFSLVYYEAKLGLLFNSLIIIVWMGMVYLFGLLLRSYIKKNKRDLLPFAVSFFAFFLSAIVDTLIATQVIVFLYTMEYSFFLMIIVMDFTLQKRFIGAFAEVERLNRDLENIVIERTSEIQNMADTLTETNKTLEEKNDALVELAQRDAMTKLLNHVTFLSRTSELLSLSKRQNFCISIIIMDIDYFKTINDKYGHLVGDQIIIKVADILHADSRTYDIKVHYDNEDKAHEMLRDYDTIGRYGGDEFAIALPFCMVFETKIIADRICDKIRKLSLADHPEVRITSSLGCAVLLNPEACKNELQLIKLADQALYKAKKQGRNQSVILTLE